MSTAIEKNEPVNTNCLEGMACPSCKSEGDFNIGIFGTALVSDDGTVDMEDLDWDDTSPCACRDCTYRGKVSDFRNDETPEVTHETTSAPTIDTEPHSPSECPKCGADLTLADCYSGGLDFDGSGIYQQVHCPNDECGHKWDDIYRFAATMDRETGEVKDYRPPVYYVAPDMLRMLKLIDARLDIELEEAKSRPHPSTYCCGAIHIELKALIDTAEGKT